MSHSRITIIHTVRQQQLSEDEYNSAFIKLFLLHENGLQN